MAAALLNKVEVDGRVLAYRDAGEGAAVLLLHGWPTSSFLWRNVMPAIARERRVLALDLPGFGGSAKPTDVTYDLDFFTAAVRGFLDALAIDDVALGLHDLGGPIGMRFSLDNPRRVRAIALLNTGIYVEDISPNLVKFVETLRTPGARERLTSAAALVEILRLGTATESSVTDATIAGLLEPFASADDRLALAKAGAELEPVGISSIAGQLKDVRVPVRLIYGRQDRILEEIDSFAERIRRDFPHAQITALPNAGHFLQEDDPDHVGELLGEFFVAH
jgi:haloalkane dehalogenase